MGAVGRNFALDRLDSAAVPFAVGRAGRAEASNTCVVPASRTDGREPLTQPALPVGHHFRGRTVGTLARAQQSNVGEGVKAAISVRPLRRKQQTDDGATNVVPTRQHGEGRALARTGRCFGGTEGIATVRQTVCARSRSIVPETPLSSTAPIASKPMPASFVPSATDRLTRTSPGRA